MTTTYASPYSGYQSQPYQLPNPSQGYGGKLVVYLAKITYAAQAAADDIKLFKLPKGCLPLFGFLNADTSSGSTTIAIGISGSTGKYRAAAAFTATNTPTLFGVVAGLGIVPLAADEEILATLAAATAPGSGTLYVGMVVATF